MPQPLLARCAGALRTHGHDASIFDDGTVDALNEVSSVGLSDTLYRMSDGSTPPKSRWSQLLSLPRRKQTHALTAFLDRRIERALANNTETGDTPQLAVLFAQRRKDVQEARRLAQSLKSQCPGRCVVIAGKMAERYGRQLMTTCTDFDVACIALPESSIPSLAAHWNEPSSWSKIPGLLSRTATGLHESPGSTSSAMPANTPPAYHPDAYPALLNGSKFNLFTLGQSSGLSHVGHYRGGVRSGIQTKPIRQLRQEIVGLHELYGAQVFHIEGSHTPGDGVLDFARNCLSLPFPIAYSRDAHVFEVDSTAPALLAASGCRALGFSLLTGSQMTLSDYFGENWTISDVVSCLKACRESNIHLHTDFIHPVPVDDHHTRAETIRLLHRCQPDSVRLQLPSLVPGSAWHQHAAEFNFSLSRRRLDAWTGATALGMNTAQEAALLPYTPAGKQGATVAQLVRSFENEMEGFPSPIESGCQAGLIARVSGWQGKEIAYIQQLEQAIKTLDVETLRTLTETFNVHATASINTVDFYPSATAKKAVGD